MAFSIRFARPDDLPEMYLISVKAHQDNYAELIPEDRRDDFNRRYTVTPEHEQKYVDKFRGYLDDDRWFVWVAESGGKVVGYTLAFKENEHLLHKKGLFMNPDYQGEGIGSALFKESLTPIESGEIDLSVIGNNARARHIYEKNGFKPMGPDPKLYYGAVQEVMKLTKP